MRKHLRLAVWWIGAAAGLYAGFLVINGNFHSVLAGQLYRSAQPSAEQIAAWHERYGIATIINLRGPHPNEDWYRLERSAAREFGITMVDYPLTGKRDLTSAQIEELLAILSDVRPPVLIHCRNGADRSGLVSALYVAAVAHGSEFYAELQLTPLYGHLPLWFLPYFAMDRTFETAEPRLGFPDS
jgi:protein tyrosine/serine phosphatase